MAQINFTLDHDFFIGLFKENRDEAFGKLMEAMLNQVLKAESNEQLGAENYERSDDRQDYRNGSRERGLTTRIGKLILEVPRHRNKPFRSLIFENYQRNEQALIATMMEMVVQGVSTRKIELVTEELCGEKFSRSTVSDICKQLDEEVTQFKYRDISARYPFVYTDAIYLKVREDHRVTSRALMVAIGINDTGHKEILGFDIFDAERESTWIEFFKNLSSRGLKDVDLVVSDAHEGLVNAIRASFPGASWQRCQVHFVRNIMNKCPVKYQAGMQSELSTMFNCATLKEARELCHSIVDEYRDLAPDAVNILDTGFDDSMTVMALPLKYRKSLRTSNIIERLNREIRRRDKVIGIYPSRDSVIRLIGSVLIDQHNKWSTGGSMFDMLAYYNDHEKIIKKMAKKTAD